MNDPIKISDLPIYQQGFAKECDKDGNGILETTDSFDEISLFNQKIKDVMDGKLTSGGKSIFSQQDVAPADATRVADSPEVMAMKMKAEQTQNTQAKKQPQPINKKIDVNYPASLNKNITYDTEVLNQALNNVLKKSNSKLKNTADSFLENAQKENVDPFICIGIAMHESANGTSWAARNRNNIGGIADQAKTRKAGRFVSRTFQNVQDSIKVVVDTISTRVKNGNKTINSIANSGRYCAKSVAPTWANNVANFAEQVRQEYNRLLQAKQS